MCEYEQGLVSVIVPTFNAERFVEKCLQSIANQSYPKIETIIVDAFSKDETVERARKFDPELHQYGVKQGREAVFGAPYQRNYGVSKSKGEFVYYVDADMELTRDVITECVNALSTSKAQGVIVPEISFGKGYWSACRSLERRCHAGDDLQEAPRFFKKEVWEKLEGLDTSVGGGDDWDLYHRFKRRGFKAARVANPVYHNEGELNLKRLVMKRYMFAKQMHRYLQRHGAVGYKQFSPLRAGYIRNRRLLAQDPVHAAGVVAMRIVDYTASIAGLVMGRVMPSNSTPLERKYGKEERTPSLLERREGSRTV